ncbi:ribosomal protein S2 [Meira miltonrushii]|uniref:Ribosomal protein S2 n=1 Tax=Meira miltonrushii TaxID=1280837 RepID=A0A316VBS0_9BASI|nr:ribosomal protein S2 [Meira miltonrushii]PWN35012.1 ribosomal protein S2 [Meira miltonrushii]
MASPLASTSRHMLGNSGHGKGSVSGLVRRAFTSSAYQKDALTASGSSVREAEPVASSKEYYDNLKANERQAAIDQERERLHIRQARLRNLADLGSTQTRENSYRPHHGRLNPITARQLTVSHLMAATAHVGHAKSSLSRASAGFVYGTRNGQTIIDVERFTLPALRLACKIVKETVFRDGVVVFLGTAEGTEHAIVSAAKRLGKNGFHVTGGRWLPGTLSNAPKVLGRAILANVDEYETYLLEADPLNLATQRLKPDLIVVLNPKSNLYAINEATQAGVPTIGVIDTDVDPRLVTYAIPANDESVRTCELVVGLLSKAGQEGLENRKVWEDEQDKKQSKALRNSRRAPSKKAAESSEATESSEE